MGVYYGIGGPILLDEVCCTGTESNLLECTHAGIGIHRCETSNPAAVRCGGKALYLDNNLHIFKSFMTHTYAILFLRVCQGLYFFQ